MKEQRQRKCVFIVCIERKRERARAKLLDREGTTEAAAKRDKFCWEFTVRLKKLKPHRFLSKYSCVLAKCDKKSSMSMGLYPADWTVRYCHISLHLLKAKINLFFYRRLSVAFRQNLVLAQYA